jgi:protein tyrosine kinase/Calx-beta domain-containing protein
LDDDMQTNGDSARGSDTARDVRSDGGNAGAAGSARSSVHSVRPVGSLVGDRFVVKAHLGRGRSGERYEAVDRSLSDPDTASERLVVLHFLNGLVAQQTRVLQKLETSYHQPHSWAHRNIFSVLGFGSDHGEYYFVTEELEGGTLRTILDEVAPEVPSEEETFGVISGIGDALKYAHAKGVVHGDIRAENVFVTKDLVVKVLDLLPATLPRMVPLFPEDKAAHGPSVPDARDDVYGLACIAYELFAGKHPFNSNTALEALAAGMKPAAIPSLDARSWDALVRGLALRREQRTPSVAAFLAALGVTGRERLRRDDEADRGPAARTATAVPIDDTDWNLGDRTLATPSARSAPRVREPEMRAPNVDHYYDLFKIRRDDEPGRNALRWLPWAAVLALGVGAAVYWDVGAIRERAPELIAAGRGLANGITAQTPPSAVGDPVGSPPDVAPAASRQPANAQPAAGSTPQQAAVASNNAATAPKAESPPPRDAGPAPKDVGPGPKNAGQQPKDASPVAKDTPTSPKVVSAQPAAAAEAGPPQATQVEQASVAGKPVEPEAFEPEQAVVVIPDAAPSATVTIRRRGALDANTSVVWWTSDGTAVADRDYVNFGARIERFAAGEQARTIHIPIVHDPKRKGRESFYVNVRAGNSKREDPAQRIEVILEPRLTTDALR